MSAVALSELVPERLRLHCRFCGALMLWDGRERFQCSQPPCYSTWSSERGWSHAYMTQRFVEAVRG